MTRTLEPEVRTPSPARLPYNPGLDGLRACAVAAVIASHAGVPGIRGYHGVTVFFVLSGYLITSLLLRERASTGGLNLPRFYLRRLARLAPAMVLVVVVTVAWLRLTDVPLEKWWLGAVGTLTYTMDIVQQIDGNDHVSRYFQWSWSLGLEEQFYLVWPLLVLAIWALGGRQRWSVWRWSYLVLGGLYVIFCAARFVQDLSDPTHEARYFGPVSHLDALVLGAAIAVLLMHLGDRVWLRRVATVLGVIGVAGLVLVFSTGHGLDALSESDPAGLAQAGLFSGFVVLWVAAVPRSPFGRLMGLRPLAFLGILSYGLYLWNQLLIGIFEKIFDVPPAETWWGVPWAGGLVLVCWLSWKYVETPLRKRWAPRS